MLHFCRRLRHRSSSDCRVQEMTREYYEITQSRTSPLQPPQGEKKVAVVERFKQESMYGLSAKKLPVVERQLLVEVIINIFFSSVQQFPFNCLIHSIIWQLCCTCLTLSSPTCHFESDLETGLNGVVSNCILGLFCPSLPQNLIFANSLTIFTQTIMHLVFPP